jgi:hypothetical protein
VGYESEIMRKEVFVIPARLEDLKKTSKSSQKIFRFWAEF